MHLTDEEKAILDGKKGGAASEAMALMVRYGEVIGAEKMCRVTWADLFCGAHSYLDVAGSTDFDEIFAKMALCTDRKVTLDRMAKGCICYSGVEPDCTEVPEKMYMDGGQQTFNRDMLGRFVDAGVILSGNCIPYLTGFVPVMGEHFVSCESSAVLFMNSLWGAMGNGDGIEASFCAAVCGRTPVSGMHRKANRAGTIEVKIGTAPATLHDWDMLGYALGGMLPPHAVPVFTGEFPRPNAITLKTFFASLACAAGTEMCHVPGITPEAPDKDTAFQGKTGTPVVEVTPADIREAFERINTGVRGSGSIDYITIGCPHLHVDELREIAGFLEGKRIHPDVCLDIWTTGPMKYMAERCGYAAVIENAGGNLLTGGCPSNRGYPKGVKGVAMDATKQRQDTPAHFDGSRIFLGSRQACLEAAIRESWQ